MELKSSKTNKFTDFVALMDHYYQNGLNRISIAKWIVAGISGLDILVNQRIEVMIILFAAYIAACFIAGIIWLKCGFFESSIEVGNKLNKFVREMRKKIK